jgi:predicted nuclease of predicted toxin-antitoxin system
VRWLIDEMLPPSTATELVRLGHDAVAVHTAGLTETADAIVYAWAVEESRIVVTENFSDFARLVDDRRAAGTDRTAVVFVRKDDHPRRGGLATHLARRLHEWAVDNPDPYPGVHWP